MIRSQNENDLSTQLPKCFFLGCLLPKSPKVYAFFPSDPSHHIPLVGPQDGEATIYGAFLKTICAIGAERQDNGGTFVISYLFHQ